MLEFLFTVQNLMIVCHGITPAQSELKEAQQWPDICLPRAFSFTCSFLFLRNIICQSSVLILAILLLFCPLASSEEIEELVLSEVVAKYRQAVDENPDSVEAYMNLGFVYLALDAMVPATEAFQNALRLDPKAAEGHYWLGRTYYLQEKYAYYQEKYEAAIASFQAAIGLLPDWGEAYAELALCHFRARQYDEAESAFEQAFSLLTASKPHTYRYLPPPIFQLDNQEWLDKVAPLSRADIAYYRSLISFERGLFDQAAEYCQQALSIETQYAEAHRQLGLVYVRKKKFEAAEKSLREAIRLRPEMAQAHYQLALLYFKIGKEAEAAKEMEISQQLNKMTEELHTQIDTMMRNEDKAPALANIGRLYLNEHKYEAAIWEYQKAIWHNPSLAEAHNGVGYAYAMQGQLEKAIQAQKRALQLKPEMAEAYAGLGLAWNKQADMSQSELDYESALSAYRQAIILKPDFPEALLNLGNIALKLSHLQEAETAYKNLLSLQPNLTQVHMALGHIYLRQNNFPAAIYHHQEALKQDPNLVEAHYNLGFIAIREGKLEEAIDNFNAALKVKEDMPEAHYFLGEIYAKQKQFEPAEKAYQRAIEIQPTFASAYERLAHLYGVVPTPSLSQGEREQRLGKALELARKAVELQPDSPDYLNTLSWLYYLNKDYADAEQAIKKALLLQPDNHVFKEGLKAIQQAMGAGR
jgi:tetratricopeptide (TPR) repeat protein